MLEDLGSQASSEALAQRQLKPTPQVKLGSALLEIASAMIDISDGFSSDLSHICEASNVGAAVTLVPIDPILLGIFDNDLAFDFALNGGEDFELLFTVPHEKIFEAEKLRLTRVGIITLDAGKIELIRDEVISEITPKGYTHF